ncbi:uncharacterized protein LOC131319996 isoform X2 [Rhododendron vialii]|uniref:uncharacterized protein LOC131319996 isoform X2 n=1 Tax=Rhododendron vialii TaxID=182163 RepID=UPI00265F86F8|nr:uncharacterized protein LOC131319996 isoform X2 [Rhododendron vialii]
MTLNSNFPLPIPHLNSPSPPHQSLPILHRRPFQVHHRRTWRRRRLKPNRTALLVVRSSQFNNPLPLFESLFQDLLSQFPSVNSLDLLAPSLGLASGAALYLSRLNSTANRNSPISEIGDWILFASPTPFNRFVMLRCPSVSFEGSELLENVSDRLVKEERHFVKLNSGRIQVRGGGDDDVLNEKKLVYQRVCVSTDDGGVISLDWPVNLDLTEERGLDTTVLLIPGTAEGSMDSNVRSFAWESLKRGCFPVVMNPRGCAGSPLTTPRLFTAADSDDICTAIQFINKARPWTTLMGVGWGYGANMLTKYLAEVGEKTPLTAATCIDNPFDLEEASRSSPYHIALDQKLAGGLVDILRSNKELFQGKAKGFDVEKALVANSVRDFEKSISMISYGFEAVEEFYAKSSTRNVVGKVKIPVLFIQNDDAVAPLFSIPRSSIDENPFTSLLLCSCLPSSVIASGRCAISWCHHLTIQWLAAVELGLLKGRHPLLKDVDVTINPSKGLALLEGRASDKNGRANKLLNLSQSNVVNGYAGYLLQEKLEEQDTPAGIGPRFRQDQQRNPEIEDRGLQQEANDTSKQTIPVDAESATEEVHPVDVESSQVLQTAQVVMNMLDVTMPGTLTEEQKKQALNAVGQGKTVMDALQDAVPEDVRAKLTNAVSGILNSRGTNEKLDGLMNVGPIVASGLNAKIQENVGGVSSGGGNEDPRSSGVDDDLAESHNDNEVSLDETAVGLEPELQASDTLQNPIDTVQVQPMQNMDISRELTAKNSDYSENGSDTGAQPDFPSQPESASTEDSASDQNKMDQSYTASSAEAQPPESVGNDHLKSEEKSSNSILNQSSSDSQTFSVSQALDALTGMDDSTQMAVNSVFGVIEDMITQLDNKTEVDDKNEVVEEGTGSLTENPQFAKEYNGSVRKEKRGSDLNSQSDMLDNMSSNGGRDSLKDSRTRWVEEEKYIESPDSFKGNNIDKSGENHMVSHVNKAGSGTTELLASSKPLSEQSNKVRHLHTIPLFITRNAYGDPFYKEYLRKYLLSKVQNAESLDLDRTTALFLEYIPEKDQWKLLEQPENNEGSGADIAPREGVKEVTQAHSPSKADTDQIIEPSYVIMDAEQQQEPVRENNAVDKTNEGVAIRNDRSESFVKNVISDSLKVEVGRRLSAESMNEMEPNLSRDIEHFANAVSLAASKSQIWFLDGEDCNLGKLGTLNGEDLVKAMSFAIQETSYLTNVLPYGVIVGSCLAALRKFFDVAAVNGIDQREVMALDQIDPSVERNRVHLVETETDRVLVNKLDDNYTESKSTDGQNIDLSKVSSGTIMAGAVTAALGASALLDSDKGTPTSRTLANSSEEKENCHEEPDKLEQHISEKSENNIVTSIAEKAMSVAGPVVPVKKDGEVDQDRLVALLAGLGQQGGMLKLFGKVAMLWGGIRGAMSLTDKLILFLRLAERPLLQRILGFVCMVLVLWSPVLVPLLPTLVQSWASHNSSKFAELICIIGLYSSIAILVMLWGKRIRGYDNPFEQYGLDFTSSSKIQNFLKGLVGGVVVVLSIHSLNALLGCVRLSWPSTFISYSSDIVSWIKVYGKMVLLVAQGMVTATGVALVEELIFRAWLPDEIATDLGYYRGIIISGLAFSLLQRSPWAIPGLWLLSLGLAGARQRSGGSLSIPIGLRAGIMASNFVLHTGGFLTCKPNFPMWVTGPHPFQPFSGISGLGLSLLLAMVLHPREPNPSEEKHNDNS